MTRHSKRLLATVAFILIAALAGSCTVIQNNPPVISSLQSDKSWVEQSGSCQIECDATDADGDELNYEWSASGGNITGIGHTVNWIAPEARGLYIITVVVNDGRGGETRMALPALVSINQAPVIDNLVTEQTGCGGAEVVPIDCIAYDPDGDELTYEWSATGGEISADGAFAVWTAPEEYDTYYITVTVRDGRGGITEDEIYIRVGASSGG